jgi:undecaprenyl-diphosphatase
MNISDNIFFKLYSLAHQSKIVDTLIVFCAEYLPYLVVIFIVIYILYQDLGDFDWRNPFGIIKKRINQLTNIFIPAISAWVLTSILKSIFSSPRPFIKFKEIVNPLFTHGGMDSFPSGHATFYMALALSIFLINKKLGWVYFFIALVIGLARIMTGIHFPIDILAGYLLGLIVALIFQIIFQRRKKD